MLKSNVAHPEDGATLGGERKWNYKIPVPSELTCVIMSWKGEPWWEETSWAFGCESPVHLVVGQADAESRLGVPNEASGWAKIRVLKPAVVLLEGFLNAEGFDLIKKEPSWLKAIVCFGLRTRSVESDKILTCLSFNHSVLGGVTDRIDSVWMFCKGRGNSWTADKRVPRQDLRAILKAGVSGRKAPALEGSGSIIGTTVVPLRAGLVSCRGLYPWPKRRRGSRKPVRVRTLFGAGLWTDRELSDEEVLMTHDVSETLFKLRCPGKANELVRLLSVPLRTRVAVGEVLRPFLRTQLECGEKRKAGPSVSASTKRQKVMLTDREPDDGTSGDELPISTEDSPPDPKLLDDTQDWSMYDEDKTAATKVGSNEKAVKSDDSPVPTFFWNKFLLAPFTSFIMDRDWASAANKLRSWLWRHLRKNRLRSYLSWRKSVGRKGMTVSLESDEAARDALTRYVNGDWWTWSRGSRPFFWEWPEEFQEAMRDGIRLWMTEHLTPYTKAQAKPLTMDEWEKVRLKLMNIRERGYVQPGVVDSLTSFFAVPKGDSDIRMVYDGTISGLNDSLWAPWFPLPTVESLMRALEPGSYMADADVGEMFLNFMLHDEVRKLCGVDFTLYFPDEVHPESKKLWERWSRCAMGLRTSPYQAIQGMLWAKELIMGDRLDAENIFRWDRLELNLPGMIDYDPSKAWVCKVRKDGTVACDVFIYVDDARYCGPTETECWKATQRGATILAKLGLQNAPRKTRPPGMTNGAWAGSVVHTDQGEVVKLVTQERWTKTREMIRDIANDLNEGGKGRLLDRGVLGSRRGFLVYVARTYDFMVPYLKGIHATMESWRPDRDGEGWKVKNPAWDHDIEDRGRASKPAGAGLVYKDGPDKVWAVPRLDGDLEALIELTKSDTPPRVMVRSSKVVQVRYGFGDASGLGYGSAITLDGKQYRVRTGTWVWTFGQEKSSNWRELKNLVEAIRDLAEEGKLEGCEVFLFTDNSVAERAYFRGTSTSRSLFELILELRKLSISGLFKLHVSHVSGSRMIASGIDGASRSDMGTGVFQGKDMLDFVPLHLTALERSPGLKNWISSWIPPDLHTKFLEPEDWASPFEDRACLVWTPPPAAADYAVELLAEGIHKRATAYHVIIIPRLMTARWRKVLGRATDLLIHLPPKLEEVWGRAQHEPLTIALTFPLSAKQPWKIGRFPRIPKDESELRDVCKSDPVHARDRLRELFASTRDMASL